MMDGGLWTNTKKKGGPGQTLFTYLPKADDIQDKVRVTLEPAVAEHNAETAVAAKGKGKGKGKGKPNQRLGLTVKEKRLDASTWRYQGAQHKGAHFPLAAFTANVGRRSEERYVERNKRGWKE